MTTHTVDTFGGSSVDLGSHTPDSGGPWTNIDADTNHLQTSGSNSLNATTTATGDGSYAVDVGSADMYAEMTLGSFTQIPTNGLGLAVRISDKNNFYGVARASTSTCSVLKRVGGSFTTFTSNLAIPNRGAGDLIRIEIVGTTLTIYNNGSSIYSTTDSSLSSSTKAGFYTHNTTAGTNILTKFEADAVGGSGRTLSGALTLGALSASGSIAVGNRVSGALSLGSLSAAGSLKVANRVSGALSLGSLSASGALKTANRISGALSLGALSVSGSLSVHSAGSISGALHLGPLTASGSLKVNVSSHGALSLGPLSLSGTLFLPRHMAGSLTLGPMTITGSILSGSGPVVDHGAAQRVSEQILSPQRPRITTLSPRNARTTSLSPSYPRRTTLTGRG